MGTRIFTTLALLFCLSTSYSQWISVQQLPASRIASFLHKGDTLYAGGKSIIYFSRNNGLTWDSTSAIPHFNLVTSMIIFQNELYAAAPDSGVVKSADGGITWKYIFSGNDTLNVSDFCEFNGDLYATTLGQSIFKLNPANKSSWLPFSNGLGSISSVVNAIAGTSSTLIAGTSRNGLYDYLPANSSTWQEKFLQPQVSSFEGPYDIITAHDTLFWAGTTGRFFMSTDKGLSWDLFGSRLSPFNTSLVNARQALLAAVYFTDHVNFNTAFLYIKKDSLQNAFRSFSVVTDHFTYKIDIVGNKIWDASDKGLFFMPLSNLPGITAADDSLGSGPLPVRFVSFTASCLSNKVVLTWKTAQEQNSSHFDIEKSIDGIHWTVIGSRPAAGNSNVEKAYSFTDNDPVKNCFYRIAEYDQDGKVQYTDTIRSSCNTKDTFNVWPNPVHDIAFVNVVTDRESRALIQVFDSKGALMKIKKISAKKGSNQFSMDVSRLANGIYTLSISWDNGQMNTLMQLLKN